MRRLLTGCALFPTRSLLFFLALTFGAVAAFSAFADGKTYEYTKEDANKSITVEASGIITIRLPVQMGTGYDWQVVSLPDVLARQDVKTEGGGLPGGPGVEVLRFQARKKGEGKLILSYVRPWEQNRPPEETFTLTVTVE
jgi:inhibitor of cysteine peptidase